MGTLGRRCAIGIAQVPPGPSRSLPRLLSLDSEAAIIRMSRQGALESWDMRPMDGRWTTGR